MANPGLTPEQIKALLEKPVRAATPKHPGIGGQKNVDVTVREVATWFKLMHSMYDFEAREPRYCENENCIDPRPRRPQGGQMVAMVNGKYMCRFCFISGWLASKPADQTVLDTNG